ncbi:hypothetical protein JW899_02115 [Candidatus Uhrbacteria bacterium]|nr:hypothetical protein [Candidatus Uhrbacteria bacterium]
MKKFHVIAEDDSLKVRVVASTRAGFMTAALEGLFTANRPQFVETDIETRFVARETERDFSVGADDFPGLLAGFMEEALKLSGKNGEAYVGLRLNLITDTKAEGTFLGQPVTGFGHDLKGIDRRSLKVEKNQLGYWESTVSLKK